MGPGLEYGYLGALQHTAARNRVGNGGIGAVESGETGAGGGISVGVVWATEHT